MVAVGRRAIAMLAVLIGMAGCGEADDVSAPQAPAAASAAAGRIDSRAITYEPTPACSQAELAPAGSGGSILAPPIPEVTARMDGWTIEVRWRFRSLPDRCRPRTMKVIANSVDKLDNVAFRSGPDALIPAKGMEGQLTLHAPYLDLPPYEARVSAVDARGVRSPPTTVPVTGSPPGCTASRSVALCIAEAQALFLRCVEGSAAREQCHPRAWRSRPPVAEEPLGESAP
jgi:hypothetical protein